GGLAGLPHWVHLLRCCHRAAVFPQSDDTRFHEHARARAFRVRIQLLSFPAFSKSTCTATDSRYAARDRSRTTTSVNRLRIAAKAPPERYRRQQCTPSRS